MLAWHVCRALARCAASFTVAVLDMRGHGSDRRGRVETVILNAGALSFSLSSAGHTEPILVNVLTCVRLPQTACGAGDPSLRFEHLRQGATYHLEALCELRALRLAAQDMAAQVAREVARATLIDSALQGVERGELVHATVRDPVWLWA